MFEFITDEEQRGQVGIGTLIVFIAMVLVAAIAAGVLINTAGLLQTQAEDTGQDSTDQVANNINVIGSVGSVANTSDASSEYYKTIDSNETNVTFNDQLDTEQVHTLRLTVQKSPGAADIDLAGLSIQYVGPESFANIVHHEKADEPWINSTSGNITKAGSPAYFTSTVTAESEDTVMTQESDRYELIIPLQQAYNSTNPTGQSVSGTVVDNKGYDNTDLKLLNNGANIELTMTTDSGSQRYVNLRVPDSLVGDGGGTVQL